MQKYVLLLWAVVLPGLLKNIHAQTTGAVPVYNVKNYGAVGDGKTDDAQAIQKAIDAAAVQNGGMVLLDNGVFLTSGIRLKSNIELHVTASASIIASLEVSKYCVNEKLQYKTPIRSLIFAADCSNVSITGRGKIDGRGDLIKETAFNDRPDLIVFHGCKGVVIQDIYLTNSSKFMTFLLQCVGVRVDGITVVNIKNSNNDGFDIDGSRDVIISNSNIHTLDDCIAFKASTRTDRCADIVINNCILSSRCAAIRVGPDAMADIENIAVSNCVIRNTGLNGIKIQESMGAVARNMTFSNIIMDNVKGPISIRLSGWNEGQYIDTWTSFNDSSWTKGKLHNILFENIRATVPNMIAMPADYEGGTPWLLNITKVNTGISITGTSQTRPRDIIFSNIDITFEGGGTQAMAAKRNLPDLERNYPEMFIFGDLPAYGLYMHHVSGITLNNVRFNLQTPDLRPAIVCDDADDIELNGFKAAGNVNAESLIRLENSRNVFISGSRPLNTITTFLRVEGSKSRDILLTGNKLNLAARKTELAAGAQQPGITVHP
ncbi:MAG TPA: glycosyl hydrolase family 28 protein [Agriterribacter sp.]|nr:glycosyl hydrolase family 28 protein [Agriterribacter sp.]